MPRPATRLSSLLVAPMAPVLLGGYDATMRRNSNGVVPRSAAEVHPYKMPKVEGTPAVLVASSLEICFFWEKNEKRKTLYKSRDSKKTKRKSLFICCSRFASQHMFDRFCSYDGSYHDDKPLSIVL